MRIQHVAVAFTLALVNLSQRRVIKHTVLPVATLHLQRGIGHRFAASGVNQRGLVRQRRLRAQGIQTLPRLPGQN